MEYLSGIREEESSWTIGKGLLGIWKNSGIEEMRIDITIRDLGKEGNQSMLGGLKEEEAIADGEANIG